MSNFSLKSYVLVFAITAIGIIGLNLSAAAEEVHEDDIVYGNVICILPDMEKGTVEPVVANKNCNGPVGHAHVILDTRSKEGNVYAVNGSPEAVKRLQARTKKENVAVKGKISGDQQAWIITVD